MTFSVIRSIGTLDRTGVVQTTLARIDAERFDELDVVLDELIKEEGDGRGDE